MRFFFFSILLGAIHNLDEDLNITKNTFLFRLVHFIIMASMIYASVIYDNLLIAIPCAILGWMSFFMLATFFIDIVVNGRGYSGIADGIFLIVMAIVILIVIATSMIFAITPLIGAHYLILILFSIIFVVTPTADYLRSDIT
jgi:hypothetical protein